MNALTLYFIYIFSYSCGFGFLLTFLSIMYPILKRLHGEWVCVCVCGGGGGGGWIDMWYHAVTPVCILLLKKVLFFVLLANIPVTVVHKWC